MPMSVANLLQKFEMNDEHLEANLNTMFQSVRGTKQYWFLRQSELHCMIRDEGTPTLFLTFSCAEYESPDIIDYLKIVRKVRDPRKKVRKQVTQKPFTSNEKRRCRDG